MSSGEICAIAYKLQMKDSAFEGRFSVTFTWAVDSAEGISMVVPRTWTCKLPDPVEYVDQPFGTSETKGILGGVAQPWLQAQSEVVERAIGDACTVAFAELIDCGPIHPSMVMLLGPAFPKVVGRFLSLRPPLELTICWVTPVAVPPSLEHIWRLLLPLQAGTGPAMAWSNEALLNHFGYPTSEAPKYWIQFLDSGRGHAITDEIRSVLREKTIKKEYLRIQDADAENLTEVGLPRQLRLVLDIAQQEWAVRGSSKEHKGVKFLITEDDFRPKYLLPSVARDVPKYPFNPESLFEE